MWGHLLWPVFMAALPHTEPLVQLRNGAGVVVVMYSLTGRPTKLNLPELLCSLRLCREIAITQVIM